MTKFLCLAALSSLAVCAHAQASPYPLVCTQSSAQRESHLDVYSAITGGNYYYADYTADDFFTVTVTGSSAQNPPWDLTWQSLCDNHFTYGPQHLEGPITGDYYIVIVHDYYTIDANYSEPDPNHPGQRINQNPDNGIEAFSRDAPPPYNATFVRTCTLSVTNNFYEQRFAR